MNTIEAVGTLFFGGVVLGAVAFAAAVIISTVRRTRAVRANRDSE
jgi:hypothetical protein